MKVYIGMFQEIANQRVQTAMMSIVGNIFGKLNGSGTGCQDWKVYRYLQTSIECLHSQVWRDWSF